MSPQHHAGDSPGTCTSLTSPLRYLDNLMSPLLLFTLLGPSGGSGFAHPMDALKMQNPDLLPCGRAGRELCFGGGMCLKLISFQPVPASQPRILLGLVPPTSL